MTVIGVSDVSLSFGEKTILENIGFSLNEGDHLGIIGVNGAGKTSLFKLIAGEYTPTSGSIYLAKERSFGYLRQEEAVTAKDPDQTLLDYMLSFFPDLCTMERAIADTEYRLSSAEAEGRTEELLTLSQKLAEQSEDFARKGGLTFRSRCQGMLLHMGFTEEEVYRKVTSLSGGQHTRLALSGLLAGEPDVLLLDEPTNHLDIDALGWFEDYLTSYRKTLLIISHDRYFLDKVTDKTLMVERGRAKLYSGNYSEAKIQKTLEDTSREKQYKEQQKEIARIRANIEFQRRCGQEHNFVTIRAKEKQLARMDLVEKVPEPPKEIGFSFQSRTTFSQETVKVKDLCFSYGSTPLIRNLSFLVKKNERVLVLGGNGTGKSTLMKLLTGKLTPDTGTVGLGEQVSVGYYDQEIHSFHEDKTVFEELRDEYPRKTNTEIRNALALFLFRGEEVDKPISVLSGGERARLTLAKLMLRPVNLLILDEPTNHLDIGSREALETALGGFDGTVIAVSHDRYFIDRIATRIMELAPEEETGCRSYTPYEGEGSYAAYLRVHAGKKAEETKEKTKTSDGKAEFEEQKKKNAASRAEKNRREKAEKRITVLEEEIEKLKEILFGEASSDYVKAGEIQTEIDKKEEELLSLYEIVMQE